MNSKDGPPLPDNSSKEEKEYHVYVQQKIRQGLADVDAGRVVAHAEVQRRLKKWLAK